MKDNFFNSKRDPNISFYSDISPVGTKLHQVRESDRAGGLSIFVHKEVYVKPCTDLSINSNDVESFCIEILKYITKKIKIFYLVYSIGLQTVI